MNVKEARLAGNRSGRPDHGEQWLKTGLHHVDGESPLPPVGVVLGRQN